MFIINKIKNNEAIIEIEGLVFNIEDDEDYDDYVSPEEFKEIRENLKGYTRYSIKWNLTKLFKRKILYDIIIVSFLFYLKRRFKC